MKNKLSEYRLAVLRCTARDIAEKAGVSEARIIQIESELPRYRKNWKRYAEAYGLTLDEFEHIALKGVGGVGAGA